MENGMNYDYGAYSASYSAINRIKGDIARIESSIAHDREELKNTYDLLYKITASIVRSEYILVQMQDDLKLLKDAKSNN